MFIMGANDAANEKIHALNAEEGPETGSFRQMFPQSHRDISNS